MTQGERRLLNIVVCIKQVPGTTHVQIDPETNTLVRTGIENIVNPFDMYAIEEGLRIRERYGGKVTALSMGPPQAEAALREAISMGVDGAAFVCDRAVAGSDTWATSYVLAKAIQKIGAYDLIVCGKQAIDGDTAQVGPGIADRLGIPFAAWVKRIEHIVDGTIRVQRMMDDGYEVIDMPLPALITVVKEINEPRLPSLRGKMAAKKAQISAWSAEDIEAEPDRVGLQGSPTQVIQVFRPERKGRGEILDGDVGESVSKLVHGLRRMAVL